MPSFAASLLSRTIDDLIVWISAWERRAIFDRQGYAARTEYPPLPPSFAEWRREAEKILPDIPQIERIMGHYEQLNRLAPLAIWKPAENSPISLGDFDAVTTNFQALVKELRNLERTLSQSRAAPTPSGLRPVAGMRDDLTRELSRFQRSGKPFCIALMAIDALDQIKKAHGSSNGERILSFIGNYIRCCLRPFDDAWPWGEEEILLCLKDADIRGGNRALQRVRDGLQRLPISLTNGKEINISASFGIASSMKETTVDDLLLKAGRALTRAKSGGSGRIESAMLFE